MRDCTRCKVRPDPGEDYNSTPCATCSTRAPFDPRDDRRTIQAGEAYFNRPEVRAMIEDENE